MQFLFTGSGIAKLAIDSLGFLFHRLRPSTSTMKPEPGARAMTKGVVAAVDNKIDLVFGIQYKAYWDWPEQQYWRTYLQQVRRFHRETVRRRNLVTTGDLDNRRIECNRMVAKLLMGISKIHRDRTVVEVDTVKGRLRIVKRVQQGIKRTVCVQEDNGASMM